MDFDVAGLRALYDQGRFLDVYEETRDAWADSGHMASMTAAQLAYASRLADRLGGPEIRNWLCRQAVAKDADDPAVRSIARPWGRPGLGFFEELREFEARPSLGPVEPWIEAGWLARIATGFAMYRDFARAHDLLDRARGLEADEAWVQSCVASVLLLEGRRDEALRHAESAFVQAPASPSIAQTLAEVLAKLGRLDEAVARLVPVAEHGQSFDLLLTAIWYVLAVGERGDRGEQERSGELAARLAEDLPRLAPLARRQARVRIDFALIDAAFLRGDRETVLRLAEASGAPFYRRIAADMRRGETGVVHRAAYRVVYQAHDTCLPASIAAIAGAFGDTLDVDGLSEAITFGGTPSWRASDWLASHGYAVRHFRVDRDTAIALLARGIPFVVIAERVGGSHALAAVGLDVGADLLILHDPAAERLARFRLKGFLDQEAPIGPAGMAFVPDARAHELEVISEGLRRQAEAFVAFDRQLFDGHLRQAVRAVEAAEETDPDEASTRYLRSACLVRTGALSEGMALQAELRRAHPRSPRLLTDFLNNLRRTRDSARNLQELAEIVEGGRSPGFSPEQRWQYPDPQFVAQYADHLGLNEEGYARAERLLSSALRRSPFDDGLLHIFADVLERQSRHEESVLPHRLASFLDESDDHAARSVANALRATGREEEGVVFLRERAERFGRRAGGAAAWVCYLDALEDFGRMDAFDVETERALAVNPDHPGLLAFLTEAYARAGRWARADLRYADLKATGHPVHLPAAGAELAYRRGHLRDALMLADAWVAAAPEAHRARRLILDLVEQRDGPTDALERATAWAEARPGDAELEDLLLERLLMANEKDAYLERIRRRIARNAGDAWAHRELAWRLLQRLETGVDDEDRIRAEMEDAMCRAEALSPRDAGTLGIRAMVLEHDGLRSEAIQVLLEAVERRPGNGWAIRRAWDLAEGEDSTCQARVRDRLAQLVIRERGNLHEARGLALRIATREGLAAAQAQVEAWLATRPDDPEVVEALADLWLEAGKGRSYADRARGLLEEAVERFPWHADLRHSLAIAYRELDRVEDAARTYEAVLERTPRNAVIRSNLARILADTGRLDETISLLDEGIRLDPADTEAVLSAVQVLWRAGRRDAALERLLASLDRNPRDISLREAAAERLLEVGREEDAVQIAEAGLELFPDGAYLHLVHARVLSAARSSADPRRVEVALRRALELNERLFGAAGLLAEHLAARSRPQEARAVLETILPKLEEPSPALGRLAWLRYHGGDAQGGIDDMIRLLEKDPAYGWGWRHLFGWLRERQAWTKAEDLLRTVPAALERNIEFRSERLLALEEISGASSDLQNEWETLLGDFPRSEYLLASRFDSLWELGRASDAYDLLERRIDRFLDAPFLLARWVQACAWKGARHEAVRCSVRIWRSVDDGNSWEVDTAWQATGSPIWRQDIAQEALEDLRQGRAIRRRAVQVLAEDADVVCAHVTLLDRLRFRTWWGARAAMLKGLEELLAVLRDHPHHGDAELATVLNTLSRVGESSRAVAWWGENRALCAERTAVWSRMGLILVEDPHTDPLVVLDWLRDWRTRPDAPLYSVACYCLALRKLPEEPAYREELRDAATEALGSRKFDSSARLLACLLCEASLRGGEGDRFLADCEHFGAILDGDGSVAFFPAGLQRLPALLRGFRQLIGQAAVSRADTPQARRSRRRELRKTAQSLVKQAGSVPSLRWVRSAARDFAS